MNARAGPRQRLPDPDLFQSGPVGQLLAALDGKGETVRVVGGAVRNALMGLPVVDYDCATTAEPAEVIRRALKAGFKAVPTGIEHGTVTVLVEDVPFEITTLRSDVETYGRRAKVVFGRDFDADARRRDFTMNALSADRDGTIHDPVGGLADLEARRVRFIGDAQARIREDFLRILRFFRFHAAYGAGPLDPEGLSACIRNREGLEQLSRERVRAELLRTLSAERAVETLAVMAECGILGMLLGGVAHLERLAHAAAAVPRRDEVARLAALGVEIAEDAERLRTKLRLSNEEAARLELFGDTATALRARGYGVAHPFARLLAYRGGSGALEDADLILRAAGRDTAAVEAAAGEPIPQLPFRGADILALGVAKGPTVGSVLTRAESLWIEAGFPSAPAAHKQILQRALSEVAGQA